MKICFVGKNYIRRIPEGHTNLAINIIESAKVNGLKPTILAVEPTTSKTTRLENVKQFSTLPLKRQSLWKLAFKIRLHDMYASAKIVLAKLDCDIIHLLNVPAWVYASFLNAFKLDRCPTIAHVWYHNKLVSPIFWRQELRLLKKYCDKVIVTSKYLANHYSIFLGKKIVRIPPPIDIEKYSPRNGFTARKHLGLPLDENLVGYIGRLGHSRGVLDLVKAFEDVVNARLVMAFSSTDPSDMNAIPASLRRLKRKPIILGALDFPELFYNAVDALVLPFQRPYAITDPPLTMIEALSSGLPLIITPVGSITEYTIHGYNAIHVAPSPKEIARAINRLINDTSLRKKTSHNARSSVVKFSLKNVGMQLLETYKDFVK